MGRDCLDIQYKLIHIKPHTFSLHCIDKMFIKPRLIEFCSSFNFHWFHLANLKIHNPDSDIPKKSTLQHIKILSFVLVGI